MGLTIITFTKSIRYKLCNIQCLSAYVWNVFCFTWDCSVALPWGDPEEAAGSPLNGAQWHLKYCC